MMCEFAKYMTPIYEFWIKIMQAIFAINPYCAGTELTRFN